MKKITLLFVMIFGAFAIAQTTIEEKFNNLNGNLPTNWEGVFEEGLGYNIQYSYGIKYSFQNNPDDRSLNFAPSGSTNPNASGWVLTSALKVTANQEYEYSFFVKIPVGKKVRFVFANGSDKETFSMTNILKDYSSYFTNNTTEEWVRIHGFFTAGNTGSLYFGFKGFYPDYNNSENETLTIDDLLIRKKPDCVPPTSTSVTPNMLSYNSAEVTWQHNSATKFNVKVFEHKADFDTATPVFEQAVTDKLVTVTGLQQAKTYDFYVQSNCDSQGVSDWIDKIIFTTTCAPDNETLFEDFAYSNNIGVDGAIPLCWSKIEDPMPTQDNNYHSVTTQLGKIKLGQWVKEGQKSMLITPKLSTLVPNANYRLRFKISSVNCVNTTENKGCTTNKLKQFEIGTITNPTDANTYTSFKTVTVSDNGEVSVNFDTYTGNDKYIVFKRIADNDRAFYVMLDDIYWESIPQTQPLPECVSSIMYPTSNTLLSPKNMYLYWNHIAEAESYKVKIGTTEGGDDVLSETSVNDVYYNLPTSLKLNYNTTYYITINAVNGTGESQSCNGFQFKTYKNPYYDGGAEDTIYGGYYFANSTSNADPSPIDVTYNWIDPIANNHTLINDNQWVYQYSNDMSYFKIPDFQFTFPFFANSYGDGKVYINHNGAIYFRDNVDSNNTNINASNDYGGGTYLSYSYKNVIAAFYSHFKFGTTKVYYNSTPDLCVVTWYKATSSIYQRDVDEVVTAQVIMYKNGDIKIQINSDLSTIDETRSSNAFTSFYDNTNIALANDDASKVVGYKMRDYAFGSLFNEDTNPVSSLAIYFSKNQQNLSTNEINTVNNFVKVYPNPAEDRLNINSPYVINKVSVYSILGQKIVTFKNSLKKVNVSKLPQGVYLLKVNTEKGNTVLKFVKK